MQITDILAQTGGLRSIAQQLGVTESEAVSGADALMPAILGGFKKQTQTSGVEGLNGLLAQLGAGRFDSGAAEPSDQLSSGNQVLGQIFGSKDVSRAVAQNASAQSGLSTDVLKKMLPMVAMLITSYMAKRGAGAGSASIESDPAEGGLGGLLGNMLGGGQPSGQQAGGLGSLLDMNGDGNALDDIMRMAGKFMR